MLTVLKGKKVKVDVVVVVKLDFKNDDESQSDNPPNKQKDLKKQLKQK